MRVGYYAIYDDKARTFGQLFPAITPGAAERSFTDSVRNPESQHSKYPEDFTLYHLLDFDDEQGVVVESYQPPQLIVKASQLVR